MGSLTNAIGTLEGLVVSSTGEFHPDMTMQQIRGYLSSCEDPAKVQKWHDDEMACVRDESGNPDLEHVLEKVGKSLIKATNRAAVLRSWAVGDIALPSTFSVHPKDLLHAALTDVLAAFRGFEVVAREEGLRVGDEMRTIMVYLRKVFSLTAILGCLVIPDWFTEWVDLNTHTELEGFKFDTRDSYLESQVSNPTRAGVLARWDSIPAMYLPANPTPPVPGDDPYYDSVIRNL